MHCNLFSHHHGYLALALLANNVLAVPSHTDNLDSAGRDHGAWPLGTLSPGAPHRPAWLSAGISAIDRIYDYLYPTEVHCGLPSRSRSRPKSTPKYSLAQYSSQVVLRFNVSSVEEAAQLAEACDTLFLDVWNESVDAVDIRLDKDVVPSLLGLLPPSLQTAHQPLMQGHELTQAVLNTLPSRDQSTLRRTRNSPFTTTDVFFDDYQSLNVITHWQQLLHSLFPTHVRRISIGQTYEGRDIPALLVGVHPTPSTTQPNPKEPRRTIVISAGAHAREWISTTTVNYIAYSLITRYGKDAVITSLLESLDFLFIPTLNPDGYAHSFSVDRLWRKSRQPTSLSFCPGIDLDRSWPFHWDGERTRENPCSESFAGAEPLEAVESRSFAEWTKNVTDSGEVQFVGLLDLHSYSQEILYPYSYSCAKEPPTVEDLQEMGYGIARAIGVSSREYYHVLPACEGNVAMASDERDNRRNDEEARWITRSGGGGSLLDYFYSTLGVKKAFQIKLRDKGVYGFLLPKEFIVPTGEEVLGAVEWFARELERDAKDYSAVGAEEVATQAFASDRRQWPKQRILMDDW